MSDIVVKIDGIDGESLQPGFENQIECVAMTHVVDLPVVAKGAMRTEGASRHGAVELEHSFDKATPALRHAASAGTNLGKVTITRRRTVGGDSKVAEVVTLANAYVVRIGSDTALNPQSREPSEEPMETFALEYSEITWDYKRYVNGMESGSVIGGWSTATQQIV